MVSALADSYGLVLLGDTFIRNFYTVFNYSAPYSVSLAKTAFPPTLLPSPAVAPTIESLTWWETTIIVIVSVIILSVLLVCKLKKKQICFCCYGKEEVPNTIYSQSESEPLYNPN